MMKKTILSFALLLTMGISFNVFAGNCQHYSDTAKDGSLCENRSADSRPVGK